MGQITLAPDVAGAFPEAEVRLVVTATGTPWPSPRRKPEAEPLPPGSRAGGDWPVRGSRVCRGGGLTLSQRVMPWTMRLVSCLT